MSNENIKERQEKLLELTRSFCDEKLDNEYLQLCEKLITHIPKVIVKKGATLRNFSVGMDPAGVEPQSTDSEYQHPDVILH